MCKIQITRDSGWADRFRNYKIILDGVTIGKIANGGSETFDIESGPHELQIAIDWCTSNRVRFDTARKALIRFECESSLRGLHVFKAFVKILHGKDSYIRLREVDGEN